MAKYNTITSANSIIMLSILGLFPVPQQLQGFSADAGFSTEAFASVETVMGVDGNMSAGWVPVEKKMSIMIMPDSPSILIFDAWYAAQEAARELFFAEGVIILPAVAREFTMLKGVMSTYMPIPEIGKVLKARTFGITFQSILPAPI
jgi:hypothetical protein